MYKWLFYYMLVANIVFSQPYRLRHGMLLFQQLDCGSFCEAIMKVTPAYKNNHYSHVGMVFETDTGTFVMEAISRGVVLTPIDTFIKRTGKDKIRIGKVPDSFIPNKNAMLFFLNKPYDTVFNINNDAYYCSELVYELYKNSRHQHFFNLRPMTFKDPDTKEYFPAWVEYFKNMNVPIPEGEPGINPGGMMNEQKIKIYPLK